MLLLLRLLFRVFPLHVQTFPFIPRATFVRVVVVGPLLRNRTPTITPPERARSASTCFFPCGFVGHRSSFCLFVQGYATAIAAADYIITLPRPILLHYFPAAAAATSRRRGEISAEPLQLLLLALPDTAAITTTAIASAGGVLPPTTSALSTITSTNTHTFSPISILPA